MWAVTLTEYLLGCQSDNEMTSPPSVIRTAALTEHLLEVFEN